MAKQRCAVCGTSIGILTSRFSMADQQIICGKCCSKGNLHFKPNQHTLQEYHAHLKQVADGNRIYGALFKTRINLKQEEEGSPFKGLSKKNNSDETVKKFGSYNHCIWLVEDFGLILLKSIYGGVEKEENERSLVFRYSELASYRLSAEYATTNDERKTEYLYLTFNSPNVVNEISVQILGKDAYKIFDNYFAGIINGDKKQWDILADNALAKVCY